jgi:hypothetical protein
MSQRLKSACTHIYVRTALPQIIDRPHELLPTPPPRDPHQERERPDEHVGKWYPSSRGKALTSPSILRSLYQRERGSLKSGLDHPHDPSMFLPWTDGAAGARRYALDSRPTEEE